MRVQDILLELQTQKVSETATSRSVRLTEHLLQKPLESLYHVFVEVDTRVFEVVPCRHCTVADAGKEWKERENQVTEKRPKMVTYIFILKAPPILGFAPPTNVTPTHLAPSYMVP
jgi:hypothetical protein